EQPLRFDPAVSLDIADQDIDAFGALVKRSLKHGVGFAYTSGGTKEDFEFATGALDLLGLDAGQQLVGIRALFHNQKSFNRCQIPHTAASPTSGNRIVLHTMSSFNVACAVR